MKRLSALYVLALLLSVGSLSLAQSPEPPGKGTPTPTATASRRPDPAILAAVYEMLADREVRPLVVEMRQPQPPRTLRVTISAEGKLLADQDIYRRIMAIILVTADNNWVDAAIEKLLVTIEDATYTTAGVETRRTAGIEVDMSKAVDWYDGRVSDAEFIRSWKIASAPSATTATRTPAPSPTRLPTRTATPTSTPGPSPTATPTSIPRDVQIEGLDPDEERMVRDAVDLLKGCAPPIYDYVRSHVQVVTRGHAPPSIPGAIGYVSVLKPVVYLPRTGSINDPRRYKDSLRTFIAATVLVHEARHLELGRATTERDAYAFELQIYDACKPNDIGDENTQFDGRNGPMPYQQYIQYRRYAERRAAGGD